MPKRDTIKENVRKLLEKYPDCRDDDKELIWTYWDEIDGLIQLGEHIGHDDFIYQATSVSRIVRCRAIIQNEEKQFLPTTWEVARKRKIEEKEWREYMGCHDSIVAEATLGANT